MSLNYSQETLAKVRSIVDLDQFDDEYQNTDLYQGVGGELPFREFVGRNLVFGPILDIGCGKGDTFDVLPITHAVEPNCGRMKVAKERGKGRVSVMRGWLEFLPFKNEMFSSVLSWGTFTYARSPIEALIEVNRVLRKQGVFIFDVVTKTNLPICFAVEIESFIRYVQLFGFTLLERREFAGPDVRVALTVRKDREFEPERFLIPQVVGGEINNFLYRRDWFLK